MAERKTGAGVHLSGVLERSMPPRAAALALDSDEAEPTAIEPPESEPAASGKGRGPARAEREPARKTPSAGKTTKKIKGHTIYLPDDLFERIIVQAHRRDKTISEYVTMVLERQVPDHRTARVDTADGGGE